MNSRPASRAATSLLGAWRWATTHRPLWGIIAAIVWSLILWPFLSDLTIAVLCGMAFGAVSAISLPQPPAQPAPRTRDRGTS